MKTWLIRQALKLFKFKWIKSPEWTEEDSKWLESVLKSPRGIKLHTILVNQSFSHDSWATQQKDNLKWACGVASGFRICIASLQNLSANASPQESENNEFSQAGGL